MALAGKTSIVLGTLLFAAGVFAACAGDGVDNGDNASGTGGKSTSGSGGSSSSSGSGGSSSSSGSGGSSSSSGSGGSSSSSGSGGSSGSSTGGITTVGGFHSSGTYKGYFWTSADSKAPGTGTSTITPADFSVTPKICASGTAAKVPSDTAYSTHWGTLVGWNLSQAEMPPNDPVKVALTGTISVGISGATVPSGLRIKVAVGGVDYCAPLTSGSNTVPVSSLKKECWLTGGATYGGEPVDAVAIQVTTNTTSATPFDFCVTSMSIQ